MSQGDDFHIDKSSAETILDWIYRKNYAVKIRNLSPDEGIIWEVTLCSDPAVVFRYSTVKDAVNACASFILDQEDRRAARS